MDQLSDDGGTQTFRERERHDLLEHLEEQPIFIS
jgi:hypothetical protein